MDDLRAKMCDIGCRAYARGLVTATEGNFSVRVAPDRVLCTPTTLSKGLLTPGDLCEVTLENRPVDGERRPSSEIRMHLAVYRRSATVQAIVHAHPPFATTFAVLGEGMPGGLLPEGELFLGEVPLVPYGLTGSDELADRVAEYLPEHTAALLQNHGAVTWGRDLEEAYTLMETLEAACRVAYQARLIGTPQPIPADRRGELRTLRREMFGR